MGRKKKGSSKLLKEAISDVNKEIRVLGTEKTSLKREFTDVETKIEGAQGREKKLQECVGKLIEKEASLKKKEKDTQEEIEKIENKLGKMKKIKSEMVDL